MKDKGHIEILYKNINLAAKRHWNEIKVVVVVVNHCFTSLFGTKGLLSDIVIG